MRQIFPVFSSLLAIEIPSTPEAALEALPFKSYVENRCYSERSDAGSFTCDMKKLW